MTIAERCLEERCGIGINFNFSENVASLTSDLANLQGSITKLLEMINTVSTYVEKVRVRTRHFLLCSRIY